ARSVAAASLAGLAAWPAVPWPQALNNARPAPRTATIATRVLIILVLLVHRERCTRDTTSAPMGFTPIPKAGVWPGRHPCLTAAPRTVPNGRSRLAAINGEDQLRRPPSTTQPTGRSGRHSFLLRSDLLLGRPFDVDTAQRLVISGL